jgi:TPR repeat protein
LGDAYAKGKGINKDWSEAANWYIKAACQGEAKAQFALGVIYEKGKGVKKILDEALKWYSEAAKQGNAEAIRKVAKLKKSGFFQ